MTAPTTHPAWCDPANCTVEPGGRGWHQSRTRTVGPAAAGTFRFDLWLAAQDPTPGFPRSDIPHLILVVVFAPSPFPDDVEVPDEEILVPAELILPLGRFMVELGKVVTGETPNAGHFGGAE